MQILSLAIVKRFLLPFNPFLLNFFVHIFHTSTPKVLGTLLGIEARVG